MSNARKLLEDKLKGVQERKALGGPSQNLPSGTTAAQELAKRVAQNDVPLRAYLVFDTTYSMTSYIHAVRDCIEEVGNEILAADQGIEVCVIGFGEHQGVAPSCIKNPLGDYGQDNKPTTDKKALKQQIYGIVAYEHSDHGFRNSSDDEAYECVAHSLIQKINEDRESNGKKKYVVVLFGDNEPHEAHSCPFERGPEQIDFLASIADHSYFVDCNSSENTFKKSTYGIVEGSRKTTYIDFKDARDVLPEAIIGMVMKQKSPQQFQEYLTRLDGPKAQQVAGLLGYSRS